MLWELVLRGLAVMGACQGEKYRTVSGIQATQQQRPQQLQLPPYHIPTPTVLTVPDATALATDEGGVPGAGDITGLGMGDYRRTESRMTVTRMCHVGGMPYPCQ